MSRSPYLTDFQLHVMLALVHLSDEAYGAAIRREITERTGRQVWIGPFYTALRRLREQGLVTSWQSDALPVRGGRARTDFPLSAHGRGALTESLAMLERMQDGLRLDGGRAR